MHRDEEENVREEREEKREEEREIEINQGQHFISTQDGRKVVFSSKNYCFCHSPIKLKISTVFDVHPRKRVHWQWSCGTILVS
jgi:hypothetical protein